MRNYQQALGPDDRVTVGERLRPTGSRVAILRVSKLRSAKDAKPLIKVLLAVDGVENVVADYRSRTLVIVPKSKASIDASVVWCAIEDAKAQPVRLTLSGVTYAERPKRHQTSDCDSSAIPSRLAAEGEHNDS